MATCNQCNKRMKESTICLLSPFNEEEDMPDYYCSKKCLVLKLDGIWPESMKKLMMMVMITTKRAKLIFYQLFEHLLNIYPKKNYKTDNNEIVAMGTVCEYDSNNEVLRNGNLLMKKFKRGVRPLTQYMCTAVHGYRWPGQLVKQ